MSNWTPATDEEGLGRLIRDWLRHQRRSQVDLQRSLHASSTRMPALLEVLAVEHHQGGLPQLVARLCAVEQEWRMVSKTATENATRSQIDLLLREIHDDCDS